LDNLGQPNGLPQSHLTIDKFGDLVVTDGGAAVSIYPPKSQTPAMSFKTGLFGFINIALTGPNDHHLFVAAAQTGTILKFAFPSGTPEPPITLPVDRS
jgi:hypothetical protein